MAALVFVWAFFVRPEAGPKATPKASAFAGSESCRDCHARFYELWSTSFHGLAMQPYTEALASQRLAPQREPVAIGPFRYRAEIAKGQGWVVEEGPGGTKKYPIEHVLGGKNVFYLLTSLEKGRLQTLPVAYDVNAKAWIDMAASAVRHVPGERRPDEPLNWREWPYTFNTSCYGCHVSRLSTNYDPGTDTYRTTWAEPGISCETCHGPSAEHDAIARATPRGRLRDLRIVSIKAMSPAQRNDLCASCHAKASAPLTTSYGPKQRFFDHFDLVTLENPDYYPDGRDLGENYTYTSWLMSPCAKAGKLDCLHCHTSSGRYRFEKAEDANKACLPCHAERVSNAAAHTRHQEGSVGNRCVSCHMPTTSFARMKRSDHSMLPPVPSATIAYQSPNACNVCHSDKDAAWADEKVRQWRPRDYQAPLLHRASLVAAARRGDWRRQEEMLRYVTSRDRDEVFAASLIRLIPPSADPKVAEMLREAVEDPSPLVRASAVEALGASPSPRALPALVAATADGVRLVRIRAAAALSAYPELEVGDEQSEQVRKAGQEYLASLLARPDQWSSHYNLGNYHLSRGELGEAVASYDRALQIEPRAVMAMVNASIAHARLGELGRAQGRLEKALQVAPESAAALFNRGLLEAELNDPKQAESDLKAALKHDPLMDQAAYNLCVLLAEDKPGEAVGFCREARRLRPDEPKYAFTLAFTLQQQGATAEATSLLRTIVAKHPVHRDARALLLEISARAKRR